MKILYLKNINNLYTINIFYKKYLYKKMFIKFNKYLFLTSELTLIQNVGNKFELIYIDNNNFYILNETKQFLIINENIITLSDFDNNNQNKLLFNYYNGYLSVNNKYVNISNNKIILSNNKNDKVYFIEVNEEKIYSILESIRSNSFLINSLNENDFKLVDNNFNNLLFLLLNDDYLSDNQNSLFLINKMTFHELSYSTIHFNALFYSILFGNIEIINELIKKGFDINITNINNKNGLFFSKNLKTLKLLFKLGINYKHRDCNNDLFIFCDNFINSIKESKENKEIFSFLGKYNILEQLDTNNNTFLINICKYKFNENTIKILIDNTQNLIQINNEGENAFGLICNLYNDDLINYMINKLNELYPNIPYCPNNNYKILLQCIKYKFYDILFNILNHDNRLIINNNIIFTNNLIKHIFKNKYITLHILNNLNIYGHIFNDYKEDDIDLLIILLINKYDNITNHITYNFFKNIIEFIQSKPNNIKLHNLTKKYINDDFVLKIIKEKNYIDIEVNSLNLLSCCISLNFYNSAIYILTNNLETNTDYILTMICIEMKYPEIFYLILKKSFNPNHVIGSYNALMWLCKNSETNFAIDLLKTELCNIEYVNNNGESALTIARDKGLIEVINFIRYLRKKLIFKNNLLINNQKKENEINKNNMVYDIINLEYVDINNFLEDDNLVFKIDNIIIGIPSNYLIINGNIDDKKIFINCNIEYGFNTIDINNMEKYINMESLGLKLEDINNDIAILIKYEDFLDHYNNDEKYFELIAIEGEVIQYVTTLYYLNNPESNEFSRRCQGNYVGQVYKII